MVSCVLFCVISQFFVIQLSEKTVLPKQLLIKRRSNALMKIYGPSLEYKNNRFPSGPRKHCQKSPSQNILCSLKLPSGPPQIHFSANPAGLLCVFLSYISPQWVPPKVFLMSCYDTSVGHLWVRETGGRRKQNVEGGKHDESKRNKPNQIDRREISDRWMERMGWVDCESDPYNVSQVLHHQPGTVKTAWI